MLVLALLLAIVLRSLIAPLYLVASVGLSYLASLGFAVLVFVIIGGQDGINFVLPFFMFIFIMALGQDYNILVMTRIREEAHHAPIKVAVRTRRRGHRHHRHLGRPDPGRDLRRADRHRRHPDRRDRRRPGRRHPARHLLRPHPARPVGRRCSSVGGTGGRRACPTTDRDHGSSLPDLEWIDRPPGGRPRAGRSPCDEPSTVSGRGQPTQTL